MILAADPLFKNGVDGGVLLIVIGKTIVVFALLLVLVLLYIWFLRKVIADMQNRIGPERAGPFGVLQSLADGTKLFFKEAFLPAKADKFVYKLAPLLAVVPAFLIFSIVPIGTPDHIKIIAYNLDSKTVHASMTGWEIDPGKWEMTVSYPQGDAAAAIPPSTVDFERSATLPIAFAAQGHQRHRCVARSVARRTTCPLIGRSGPFH